MAKFRQIYLKIWKDPDFQNYSPEGKLLFIYFCTNQSTTESGIYPVTLNTIANETSIQLLNVKQLLGISLPTYSQPIPNSSETVQKQLANGLKNVYYDIDNQCVWVKNFKHYNTGGSPKLVAASILSDCLQTKTSPLWADFIKEYPEYSELLSTVGKQLANSITPNVTNVTKLNITKQNVIPDETFAQMVKIYEQEIGSVATPMIAEELKDIQKEYSLEIYKAGLKQAVSGNHRNLHYAITIMKDYKVNGIPSSNGKKPQEQSKPLVGKDGWGVTL